MKPRYLSKSRFKLALDCPTKLYYTGKKEYMNLNQEDSFLAALAEGGFQVGALAKAYYSKGIEVDSIDYDESLKLTSNLLEEAETIIFEGAFKYQNLFIRADIVEKKGNFIKLIEVKAKSFDGDKELIFINKKGKLIKEWIPYIYDLAFQTYVIRKAYPAFTVLPYLMLADKNKTAETDGLNQKFFIQRSKEGRTKIVINKELTNDDLKNTILATVPFLDIVDRILADDENFKIFTEGFEAKVKEFSVKYETDIKIKTMPSAKCKNCEFNTKGLVHKIFKSGFQECWLEYFQLNRKDFTRIFSFDLWNSRKKDSFLEANKLFITDLNKTDINPQADSKLGLSTTERQWLQVKKVINNDNSCYIDKDNLLTEFKKFKYPLHLIDFETTAVAIPFYKGMSPYESIAFQFSHHTMTEKGLIEHKGQYINTKQGFFPNFEFIRELKKELQNDNGTIFCYSGHENTILNSIMYQLTVSEEKDKADLISFIKSISKPSLDSSEKWIAVRLMVDMLDLVKRYYYHPMMGGSNSIKNVLPAVLNDSKYLQMKYSKPIYGTNNEIKSLNFSKQIWIKIDPITNEVLNPYDLLPSLLLTLDEKENVKLVFNEDRIQDGGAALTAYSKLQFTEAHETERQAIIGALLKYCELDTFAMVLILEYWFKEAGLL